MRLLLGLFLAASPFLGVWWLMGRMKRNRGSLHGGGIRRYWRIISGR